MSTETLSLNLWSGRGAHKKNKAGSKSQSQPFIENSSSQAADVRILNIQMASNGESPGRRLPAIPTQQSATSPAVTTRERNTQQQTGTNNAQVNASNEHTGSNGPTGNDGTGNSVSPNPNSNPNTINDIFSCDTKHAIYLLQCTICGKQYIGESGTTVRIRMRHHRNTFNSNWFTNLSTS